MCSAEYGQFLQLISARLSIKGGLAKPVAAEEREFKKDRAKIFLKRQCSVYS